MCMPGINTGFVNYEDTYRLAVVTLQQQSSK